MSANNDIPSSDARAIAVQLRDQNRCQACSRTATRSSELEVHRIVPRPEASNQMSNFVLLCSRCHAAAHDQTDRSDRG